MANEELTNEEKKYIANDMCVVWFTHYNSIKSKFLFDVVKNASEDTYMMAWEVVHVFAEYAEKYFESLTE